jgi:tRNA-dihydrouridine synthase
MEHSGTIAVLIGRAALGKPWIFGEGEGLTPESKTKIMYEHWRMQMVEYAPDDAVIKFRKHLIWYSHGYHDACAIRRLVPQVKDPAQVEDILDQLAMTKKRRI